ncbi:MAG: hypothetical protein JXL84_07675 [Deltaproteobacteria bacterium]|nr:hypothetical protein [Deltaproteobacteria bacterium]
MDLFLLDAIPLNTDLVSKYPQLLKLADDIFEEVSGVAKITNPYRGKEALKLILINLHKGHRRGRAVRYSRDKAFYASGTRYHDIWFKYDRVIPIIDALKTLGYAGSIEGTMQWKEVIDMTVIGYRRISTEDPARAPRIRRHEFSLVAKRCVLE